MMIDPFFITIALAIVSSLVIITLVALVWLVRKHLKLKNDYEDLSEFAHSLNNEFRELCSLTPLIDERIAWMAERIEQLTEKVNTPLPLSNEPSNHPYSQAIQKVRSGASVGELMQTSGLSQDEAALLIRLHGAKTR
jgi:Protein of unknown function (DUF2802)